MASPFFSIVMPVYNGEKYLSLSIASVLAQTHHDWELIVVDDLSSDRTPEILAQYAAKHPNIRVFRNEENVGIAKSLNRGIREGKGEWIVRIDSDDLFAPAYLEILRSSVKNLPNPDSFISTWVTIINGIGEKVVDMRLPSAKKITQMMWIENFLIHSATSFSKAAWARVGGYPEQDRKLSEDLGMWKRFLTSGIPLVMISQTLIFYRIHDSNVTSLKDGKLQENESQSRALARQHTEWLCSLFLKQGELKAAQREILLLGRTQPASLKSFFYYLLTFCPKFLVHIFMWEIRPRTRSFARALQKGRAQVPTHHVS